MSYIKPIVTDKPDGLKNIFLVGNSFIFYNCGVNGMMNGFAKAKHRDLVITLVGIGGASLYWHDVKSYLRPNALRSYKIASDGTNKVMFLDYPDGKIFDAVVLEDFRESAKKHCQDIRDAGARPFFMMTWAYKDKPEMTRLLADATIKVANENCASVIPCGLAFERSLKDFPEIELIRSDNRHPTVAGTYLEATVFFASLTGIAPTDCDFYGRFDDLVVTPETGKKLQQAGWKTVKEFNNW